MRVLALALVALSLCARSQTYADSPFYKLAGTIPASAHVEGWQHGTTHANGITIDLSESRSAFAFMKSSRWSLGSHVERDKRPPDQLFHYYIQYDDLGVTFGYNLLVQPIDGTNKIKCTFSQLTDPPERTWPRDLSIALVALSDDLTPLVIQSGQVISITTYPAGKDRPAVIHYLHLTRMDIPQDHDESKSE